MTWHRSTLAIALLGSLLMWAAQPPLAWGWLAWIAPVPWLVLVRADALTGRRPYGALWLAGFAFWLAAIHWLRLPHPAVYLGWLALSAYLACYVPVFVGLARVAVHQLRVPLWLAAPVVWTGLELARAYLITGFLMGSLAHTQVHWTTLIQLSDLVGEYGVDFLVMAVAASITDCGIRIADCRLKKTDPIPQPAIRNPQSLLVPLVPAAILLVFALGYGHWRLAQLHRFDKGRPAGPRVALIQGNSLADWKADAAKQQQIMNEYISLSQDAVRKAQELDGRPIDLVVWPETMFRSPLLSFDPGYKLPPDADRTTDELAAIGPSDLASLVRELGTPVLVGIDRVHFLTGLSSGVAGVESANGGRAPSTSKTTGGSAEPRPQPPKAPQYLAYNAAVLVDRDGQIVTTYDKAHRVMFGEYIPFADWLPFLYKLSPVAGGIQPGASPVVVESDNVLYAPNICYESVFPYVIRQQAATQTKRKRGQDSFFESADDAPPLPSEKRVLTPLSPKPPDILVNLTNDAWYWGASELDMHLACDVFRAVETRTPMLVAANGGISAWIDHRGRIRAQSPRQQPDVILADVEPRPAIVSLYVRWGDWFAGLCLLACVALAVVGWRDVRRGRRR